MCAGSQKPQAHEQFQLQKLCLNLGFMLSAAGLGARSCILMLSLFGSL
jgi:hypothetical protein